MGYCKSIDVTCDATVSLDGFCGNAFPVITGTVKGAREMARNDGWRYIRTVGDVFIEEVRRQRRASSMRRRAQRAQHTNLLSGLFKTDPSCK